jgi:arylsulfatase A-like enzyme
MGIMNRVSRGIKSTLAGLAIAGAGIASSLSYAQDRPNVLVLFPDQHRADVMGVAGDPIAITPNLDRLSNEGTRFTHMVSQSPICIPTRATIQSGYYASTQALLSPVTDSSPGILSERMDFPNTTYLAEVFEDAGYATGYSGKWHLDGLVFLNPRAYVPKEYRRGYQEWNGYGAGGQHFDPIYYDESTDPPTLVHVEGYNWEPEWQTDVFLEFAERHSSNEKPWMYFVSYGPPHSPNSVPDEFHELYDRDQFNIPTHIAENLNQREQEILKDIKHYYYSMVTSIDHEVGRVLNGLDDLGISDNTIIIYSSDHGDLLGEHYDVMSSIFQKRNLDDSLEKAELPNNRVIKYMRNKAVPYQTAFRVPLIVKWPNNVLGQDLGTLVSTVDVAPTILELSNLPIPSQMQGNSLADWLIYGNGKERDAVFMEMITDLQRNSPGVDWEAVWTGRFLYSPSNVVRSLFDYEVDPLETVNFVDTPEYANIQADLENKLKELKIEASTLPSNNSSSCVIATAVYNTPLEKKIDKLREVRDKGLENPIGTFLTDLYYRVSPPLANGLSKNQKAKGVVRSGLDLVLE